MANTITITTGGTTTAVTIPEVQNTVEVTYGNITKAEREKLAGIEAGATTDQTITGGDNINVSESGGDYTINLDNTIDISGDATLTNAFVDKVLIRDTSSNSLPGSVDAAHFYVDTTFNTQLKAKPNTDLRLSSGQDVHIVPGTSSEATIGDTQGLRKITVNSSGLTFKANTHQFTFMTDGRLGIGTSSTYYMPINSSGASLGEGLKLGVGGQLEFGSVGADLSTSNINDLRDVDVDYNDWSGHTQGPNILYNSLVYDGTNWVMYNSTQGSFPPNTTNISFLGDAAPIDKSKIGFDGFNNGLSINSGTSYASSGINLYVNGGARVDGAIQVNDPSSTGYAFPTTDGTANQVLATDGSGAVTFVTPSTSNVTEGTNLYYTDARVAANSAVAANTAKTSFPGFGTTAGTALEGDTTTITTAQANAITANTAKVGYTDSAVDSRIAAASIDDLSDVDTSTVAPTTGQALVWDGTQWEPGTVSGGGSSPWTTSGSDIYYTTGNVGIGTTSPGYSLHVDDGSTTSNTLFVNSYNRIGWEGGSKQYMAGWSGRIAFQKGGGGEWGRFSYSGDVNRLVVSRALHLAATSGDNGDVRFTRLSTGKVAIGNGADDASGTLAVGNLGVGTTTPAEALDVSGKADIKDSSNNVLISTGNSTITASNTVAVGYQALTALTTGAGNTAVGYQAGDSLTTGSNNTALGYGALGSSTATTTTRTTAIGYNANYDKSHSYSTSVGFQARGGTHSVTIGHNVHAGGNSIVLGSNILPTSPPNNCILLGFEAGRNLTGLANVGIGTGAFKGVSGSTSGIRNVSVGDQSSVALTSGSRNVVMGYRAANGLTSGSDNILIGNDSGSTLTTESNKLYIENSNSTTPLIYGEFDNDILRVNGTLQVNDPASTGYSFPTATGTTGQVLEVNASGDLVFATPSGGGSDTHLGNANLTADDNRTYNQNGNDLTINPNGGEFAINDSSGSPSLPEIQVGQGITEIRGNSVRINGLTYPSTDGSNGQVLTTNGSGTLSFTTVSGGGATSFDYARAIMGSDVLQGGASQQDFDSATAQKVKFNTSSDTEGSNITIDTTNNRITVGATGYYQITSNISFTSAAAARTTPASFFKVNGTTDLLGEGYGYIRVSSGQDDNNNLITCTVELQANDYVEVWTADSSTTSGACYATQGFFEIQSVGGAAGADGAQGPSGTSYDVTTLTGSTTLSSSHTTKYLVCNSASAMNLTVPASASYDTYAEFVIEQRGAGQVTVVADTGVTIHSTETLKSGAQYAVMGLKRTDTNTYVLTGEREAAP